MMVIIAEDGKTFHVAGCPFIHDKARLRTIPAQEAEKEGYAPCVRCMKKYVETAAVTQYNDEASDDFAGLEAPDPKAE